MNFYKRVELVCFRIPQGRVATYGQIALLCQKPGNARQVGYALSHGKVDQAVPAHRIVNSKGILSGAGAFAHGDLQRILLEAEGIPVSVDNQVDLKQYGWKNTMEEALELEKIFKNER